MHRAPIRPATRDDHAQRVLRAWVHLGARLGEAHSLQTLAKVAHLSPFHFQRVFERTTGETPAVLLRRLRIERAARALLDGDAPIARVVAAAGYGSLEAFHRAFRRVYGAAPSAWRARRMRRRATPVAAPDGLRVWVNRPGRDAQLRLVPVEPAARAGRGRRTWRVEELAPLRVAFVRRVGAAEHARGEAEDFRRLAEFALRRGAPFDLVFVRLHPDDPRVTPPAKRRLDRGVVVGPRRRGEGTIGVQSIGGDHAVATVEGTRGGAARVRAWLEDAARRTLGRTRASGPVLEVLLDDPREPSPRARLADVLVPVAAAPARAPGYFCRRRPALL